MFTFLSRYMHGTVLLQFCTNLVTIYDTYKENLCQLVLILSKLKKQSWCVVVIQC